ncbi:MAG: hypothetical protein WBA16_10125 [Nonlabens sp.]
MNYTKDEIIEVAKTVMKDLDGRFYREKSVDKDPSFNENEEMKYGKNKGQKVNIWFFSMNTIGDNKDHLYISDVTGEPIFYQNFNTFVFDIVKNSNGKYELKDIDLR